ncbi:hypothetical protein GCM10022215_21750 [Nocardioides fonticola]|uniref:DUF4349 domain-containing protein n=1 Tax=Nocardioides fonticola TaxID=450363 RepID=A0ABP7XJB7_9ACTN
MTAHRIAHRNSTDRHSTDRRATGRRSTSRVAAAAAVLALSPIVAGCTGSASDSTASSELDARAPAAAGDAGVSGADGGDGGVVASVPDLAVGSAAGGGTADVSKVAAYQAADVPTGQAVISTGTIRSTSDDVARARTRALDIVTDLRGTVADEDTRTDTDGTTTSTHLVLRVPSGSFAEAMDRLAEVGDLRASSTTAQDVTTEVLDTDVRVRVQRAGIRRITALLDRAGSLRDVIRIESELSRRQADLESLLQQQKYLADQTSLGTITLDIERTGTVPDDEDRTGFLGGLRSGWDAFTGAATGIATAAGAVLPFAVVAALVGAIVVPLVRRRRGQSAIG